MASKILKVMDEASSWMAYDGVEGVGQGQKDGQDCIVVFVSCPPATLSAQIPDEFKGYPVVLQESGQIDTQ
jgi:hypothetical protein